MANQANIAVDGTISLGDGGGSVARKKIIQVQKLAACDGTLTFKKRKRLPLLVTAQNACPYTSSYLNGAVSDDAMHTTAISNDSHLTIECSGAEVFVTLAGRTVGSYNLEWEDVAY